MMVTVLQTNYTAAVEICNLWRNYGDIQDSWDSVKSIADWFSRNQEYLYRFAGPGHWNDADMLIIGDFGLSYDESIAQMTMWTVMTVPLIMSVDIRIIEPVFRDILLNKDAIRINQDPLGVPGLLEWEHEDIRIWVKPLSSPVEEKYPYAFGIVSFRDDGAPSQIEIILHSFGLNDIDGYTVKNIFEPTEPVVVSSTDSIKITVNPSGGVLLQIDPVIVNKR